MIENLIYIFFLLSFALNIILTYLWIKTKKSKHQLKDSRELQEFLVDLLQGDGLIKVSRVNPQDILLRSPRAR